MLPLILVGVGAYLIGDSVLGDKKYAKGGISDGAEKAAKKRLEQLRKELRAERISYGELAELESLKKYIDDDDVELRQAAGIPEFEDDDDDDDKYAKGGKLEVGDMVMVDDSGYAKYFSGFDVSKPAKIISKNKGKSFGKVKYFYGLETADGKKPFNQAIESMLTKVSKDGGMMEDGGMMADGGVMDVVNTEVIKVKGNIMGTTSLELKIKGMRKPQDFIVYPISNEQAGKPITIQSDTRFGYLDLSSGRGLMSQSHANGAYSYHFSMDKKVPFKISETDVQKIKEHLASKASSKAGNSVIFSDNSGADKMAKGGMMAKGGEVSFENSNLYLNGFAMDSNGNSVVKVSFPNQRAFSIQTNGVLKETNNLYTKNINDLTQDQKKTIEKEVVEYVKEFGSKEQKSKLKTYSGYKG